MKKRGILGLLTMFFMVLAILPAGKVLADDSLPEAEISVEYGDEANDYYSGNCWYKVTALFRNADENTLFRNGWAGPDAEVPEDWWEDRLGNLEYDEEAGAYFFSFLTAVPREENGDGEILRDEHGNILEDAFFLQVQTGTDDSGDPVWAPVQKAVFHYEEPDEPGEGAAFEAPGEPEYGSPFTLRWNAAENAAFYRLIVSGPTWEQRDTRDLPADETSFGLSGEFMNCPGEYHAALMTYTRGREPSFDEVSFTMAVPGGDSRIHLTADPMNDDGTVTVGAFENVEFRFSLAAEDAQDLEEVTLFCRDWSERIDWFDPGEGEDFYVDGRGWRAWEDDPGLHTYTAYARAKFAGEEDYVFSNTVPVSVIVGDAPTVDINYTINSDDEIARDGQFEAALFYDEDAEFDFAGVEIYDGSGKEWIDNFTQFDLRIPGSAAVRYPVAKLEPGNYTARLFAGKTGHSRILANETGIPFTVTNDGISQNGLVISSFRDEYNTGDPLGASVVYTNPEDKENVRLQVQISNDRWDHSDDWDWGDTRYDLSEWTAWDSGTYTLTAIVWQDSDDDPAEITRETRTFTYRAQNPDPDALRKYFAGVLPSFLTPEDEVFTIPFPEDLAASMNVHLYSYGEDGGSRLFERDNITEDVVIHGNDIEEGVEGDLWVCGYGYEAFHEDFRIPVLTKDEDRVTLTASAASAEVNEDILFTADAPGARWIRLYQNGDEFHYEDRDSVNRMWSSDRTGTVHVWAVAGFGTEDGGEEEIASEPVDVEFTAAGSVGAFDFELEKNTVSRGEMIAVIYGEAAHADAYWLDVEKYHEPEDEEEDGHYEWYDHYADSEESGEVLFDTSVLEEGTYRVRAAAAGKGYERYDCESMTLTVTETEIAPHTIHFEVSKENVRTGETFAITAFAPGAQWVEVFFDYKNDEDWRDSEGGEVFSTNFDYSGAGTYTLAAQAHYYETDEDGEPVNLVCDDDGNEFIEDEEIIESEEIEIHVAAPNGRLQVNIPDLLGEGETLPSVINREDGLNFTLSKPAACESWRVEVRFDMDSEDYDDRLFEAHTRAETLAVNIPANRLTDEMTCIRVRAEAYAAGYESDDDEIRIPIVKKADDDVVLIEVDKTEVLVDQNIRVTVLPVGDRHIAAVKYWSGGGFWDGGSELDPDGREDLFDEHGNFCVDDSWGERGEFIVYALVRFDSEEDVWYQTACKKITVASNGNVGPFTITADQTEVERGEFITVTGTEAADAEYYNVQLWADHDERYDWHWEWEDEAARKAVISTSGLVPGKYYVRMEAGAEGLERSGSNEIGLIIQDPGVPDGGIQFDISKDELLTGESYLFSAYAPDADLIRVWQTREGETWWDDDNEGDENREVFVRNDAFGTPGVYDIYAVAYYYEDPQNERTVESRHYTITVTAPGGKIVIDRPAGIPDSIVAGDSGNGLEFTVSRPENADQLEVGVQVESERFDGWHGEGAYPGDLFFDNGDGDISVALSAESLAEKIEAGDTVKIEIKARGTGYEEGRLEIRIPVVGAANTNIVSIAVSAAEVPVNEDVNVTVSPAEPGDVIEAVKIWQNGGFWEEGRELNPENHGDWFDEDGNFSAGASWDTAGKQTIYALVKLENDETWYTTAVCEVTVTSLGNTGPFTISADRTTVTQGEFITVAATKAAHADRYWIDLFDEFDNWRGCWQEPDSEDGRSTVLVTADLEPGIYYVRMAARGPGYERRDSENRIRITVEEAEIPDREIVFSVSKTEVKTNENVMFSVQAPGAEWIEIYSRTDNDCMGHWDEDFVTDSRSWPVAGQYPFYVKAWFGEEEGSFNPLSTNPVTSDPVIITVTADSKLSIDTSDIPASATAGQGLAFSVPLPANASSLRCRVEARPDDGNWYWITSEEGYETDQLLDFSVEADEIPDSGTLRIELWCWADTPGYENGYADAEIAIIPAANESANVTLEVNEEQYDTQETVTFTAVFPAEYDELRFYDGKDFENYEISGRTTWTADRKYNQNGTYPCYVGVRKYDDDQNEWGDWVYSEPVNVKVQATLGSLEFDKAGIPEYFCTNNNPAFVLKLINSQSEVDADVWYQLSFRSPGDEEWTDITPDKNTGKAGKTTVSISNYSPGTVIRVDFQAYAPGYDAAFDGVEITSVTHKMEHHDAVAATCDKDGNSEYWHCVYCGRNYFAQPFASNTEIVTEGSWIKPKTGHDLTDNGTPPTAATCTEDGNTAYWTCKNCGKYFADAEAAQEIEEGSWVIPAGHDLTAHEAKDASCEENGNKAYWECESCHKKFKDKNAVREYPEGGEILEALGHDYGKPEYEWKSDNTQVTATVRCSRDPEHHVITKTVGTSSMTTQESCDEPRMVTYTAAFTEAPFETQTKKVEVEGSAGTHDWGAVSYVWADDNSTVTAARVCGACHKEETETVNTKETVVTPPGCETEGKATYTGTFETEGFGTQTKTDVTIPATGHKWSAVAYSWADDFSEAYAGIVCENGCGKEEVETVAPEVSSVEPTCEQDGKIVYTAAFTRLAKSTQRKSVPDEAHKALGHDYGEVEYTWNEDHTAVTAKCVCTRNTSHIEEETADTVYAVTKAATCTEEGTGVYTGTFTKDAFEVQKFETPIPAAGHNLTATETKAATCTEAGNTAYWTCGTCHKYFSDAAGTKEIEGNSWVIPAAGHTSDGGKVTKEPTAAQAGVKTFTCKVCGTVISTEVIPATGQSGGSTKPPAHTHTLTAIPARAATCTAAGNTAYWTCSGCGRYFSNAAGTVEIAKGSWAVPAAGHKWDAGKVTVEATPAADGVRTYTCTACGETRTEAIPKLTGDAAEKFRDGDPSDPDSVAYADAAAAKVKDNGEPAGSSFAAIQLQSKKQTNAAITLTWNKYKGANGYLLYGNMCGKKYKFARIGKVTKNTVIVKKLADGSKLKKGTNYKFYIQAYRTVDGKDTVIATSKVAHVATRGGNAKSKANNVSKVTTNAKKNKVELAQKGKTFKLKVKTTLAFKKIKLGSHRKIRFESSDRKVAAVDAKGVIRAVKKGKCAVYVYSQTGTFAKISVTVKK